MKQLAGVICFLLLSGCIFTKRPHTSSQFNCTPLDEEQQNLDIAAKSSDKQSMPGSSVTIRSMPEGNLIWEGTTGPDGHVRKQLNPGSYSVTVELDGFFAHHEVIVIPAGERCVLVTFTREDPDFLFIVT